MIKFECILLAAVVALVSGCASTMEDVNKGAQDVGRPVGGVARVPGSFMEGAAQGVAGQPSPNPYGR
jgi:hypothetical protein